MICYIDGGYSNDGNKESNGSGYGSFLIELTPFGDLLIHKRFDLPESRTNNESEYLSLIKLLDLLKNNLSNEEIIIYSDSKLLVNQVNGNWKINYKNLQDLYNLVKSFNIKYELKWITRKEIYARLGH